MAERQPSWDKYEAAILLEGILASMKGELTRSDAVKAVSHDLRAMAVHRGIEIDAVYRNTNGISFQMKSMESAYLGRTVFKPATRLFTGVASLYHDSHDEYQKLLKEARAMIIDGKTVKDDFMRYLAEQVSPAQLSDFYICYSEIETFCLKIKVLQKPLFQTTDIETIKKVQRTIEQNKFFRITRRKQINKIVAAGRYYYNYIKEGLYSRIGIEETAVEESNTATQTFQPQHTHNIANDTMSKSVASEQSDEINSRSFSRYLSETLKMADATSRSYSSAINNCEVFAREHQLPSWQLYTSDRQAAQETIRLLLNDADFLSYNARQHNRFRAALQKFLMFIGAEPQQTVPTKADIDSASPYRNEGYEQVLREYFMKGFRMDSPLEIRKFKRYYTATHATELTDSDDDISNKIKQLCILYEGKAFLPDVMLSEDRKEELLDYIESAFADGKAAIYYQAIFAEFSDVFLDYHIHDADMLKAYLTSIGNGRFFINRSFISKTPDVSMDPLSEVRSCLQNFGRPATYDELFAALPHLPQSKIKLILASNVEFVNNGRSEYFHESIVHLSDEELDGIAEIIQRTIDERDFIGGNELYDAIRAKYPYIIEENHTLSVYGFRDALKAKLGDKFSFKGNIISRSGQEISMVDVFAKYARSHDSFTLSELQGLADSLATTIYFDTVYENSLRISRDQFVSKAAAQFPVADIDEVLDRICTEKYIPLPEVTNFGALPYVGFPWNSFLLEHYVASYSQKYLLLHSSFNGTECAGAIVKRSAGIGSFDDLIIDLLANNNQIEMKKAPVLQYLSDNGYDYSREDRKLPIHLIRELELIDELLKKIKTNLTNGDYQKAILIADHGASRLAVIHGTENLWEMQSSGKHSGRCCPKSEVDERPDSATDAEDFWALANYDRFKGSRKANVEVHGGATLEEVTVPIIEISYLNDAVEVKIMPIDSTATFTGIPEIFVSFRKKAAIKVFSTEKLVDVSVVIDGHTYEAKPTADNFYVVEEMTEIRRAKTYSVDVFAGGMPVATGLPLRVKKESGSEKNIL